MKPTRTVSRVTRGMAVVLLAFAWGCDDDSASQDPEERCDALDQQSCDSESFEGGGCYWAEVKTAPSGSDECSDMTSEGRCVAVVGTQQGCARFECSGGDEKDLWYRSAGNVEEVVTNPLCGPDIVGDGWVSCAEGAVPSPLCACGCD